MKATVYGVCARPPRIPGRRNGITLGLNTVYDRSVTIYRTPLPLAIVAFVFLSPTNPNTSEIATNQSAAISPFTSKARVMAKSDAQKKAGVMAKEW